ncbi:MAG TPA: GNAT family N-acetyltransferase [Caulobacteraceae bacterium]|jgi:predicted acetyltransferase
MSETVTVDPAPASEQPLLQGLMQFYQYDFSELEPDGSPELDFNAAGLLEPYRYLPDYWTEAGRIPLVIRRGGKPAGFALVNRRFHLGGEADRNMAEFFVARKHRRHGVASQAVRLILAAYPGRWEVAVLARNPGALAFWPRAIAAAPNVSAIVRHDGDVGDWPGPVWSFVAG